MQKQAISLCVLAAALLLSEFGVLAYKECTTERGGDLQKCHKLLQEQIETQLTRLHELADRLNSSHQLESNEKRLPELQRIEHLLGNKTLNPCPGSRGTGRKELWLEGRSEPVPVWCAKTAMHGDGWLVIQQRLDGTESFLRDWESYRDGFGTLGQQSEFWLGLEHVHQLTKCCRHELVVELRNSREDFRFVRYDDFGVGDEEEDYELKVLGQVSGTLVGGLALKSSFLVSEEIGESGEKEGGWWVNSRVVSNLNAAYGKRTDGMRWPQVNWNIEYSRMMIRPVRKGCC